MVLCGTDWYSTSIGTDPENSMDKWDTDGFETSFDHHQHPRWFQPFWKNMKVSWDDYSQQMEK
jgi:transposase-like protein